jgi:hypothetical protein
MSHHCNKEYCIEKTDSTWFKRPSNIPNMALRNWHKATRSQRAYLSWRQKPYLWFYSEIYSISSCIGGIDLSSDSSQLIDPHKSIPMVPSSLILQALNGPSRSAWVQWRASACFSRDKIRESHFTFCASVNHGTRRWFEIFIKNSWKPNSYESCDSPGKFLSLVSIGFSSNAEIKVCESSSDRSAWTDVHDSGYVSTIRRFWRTWQSNTLEISGDIRSYKDQNRFCLLSHGFQSSFRI